MIASRLSEDKFMAPLFYLTINIDMGEAMRVRKEIRAMIVPDKISFNDLVAKAAAAALRKHPNVNASWTGGYHHQSTRFRYYGFRNDL